MAGSGESTPYAAGAHLGPLLKGVLGAVGPPRVAKPLLEQDRVQRGLGGCTGGLGLNRRMKGAGSTHEGEPCNGMGRQVCSAAVDASLRMQPE